MEFLGFTPPSKNPKHLIAHSHHGVPPMYAPLHHLTLQNEFNDWHKRPHLRGTEIELKGCHIKTWQASIVLDSESSTVEKRKMQQNIFNSIRSMKIMDACKGTQVHALKSSAVAVADRSSVSAADKLLHTSFDHSKSHSNLSPIMSFNSKVGNFAYFHYLRGTSPLATSIDF
ncbi:hypothetical protein LR48_Vigan03g281800 [Vigna angularis]|uniref:Uncharacterized protein n=1 Tax=Phaseolus angularis TaxID=3914 RepID=A0A0L9U9R3_PHAAN|nr:hypothetical protein LR48_Vigan03g281800 [Vigna angularis]